MKFRFALTELMQEIKTNVLFKMFPTLVCIVGGFIAAFLLSSFHSFGQLCILKIWVLIFTVLDRIMQICSFAKLLGICEKWL